MKNIVKSFIEAGTICTAIFMLGFSIMAAMGYAQNGSLLGVITCLCATIVSCFSIYRETKRTEGLIYKEKTEEDSELD